MFACRGEYVSPCPRISECDFVRCDADYWAVFCVDVLDVVDEMAPGQVVKLWEDGGSIEKRAGKLAEWVEEEVIDEQADGVNDSQYGDVKAPSKNKLKDQYCHDALFIALRVHFQR